MNHTSLPATRRTAWRAVGEAKRGRLRLASRGTVLLKRIRPDCMQTHPLKRKHKTRAAWAARLMSGMDCCSNVFAPPPILPAASRDPAGAKGNRKARDKVVAAGDDHVASSQSPPPGRSRCFLEINSSVRKRTSQIKVAGPRDPGSHLHLLHLSGSLQMWRIFRAARWPRQYADLRLDFPG